MQKREVEVAEETGTVESETTTTTTLSPGSGKKLLPKDVGLWAWASAWGGHIVLMDTWGFGSSFGVFQSYYTTTLNRSPSDISWIGSVQLFCIFFIGAFAGRLTDAGYFRVLFAVGTVMTGVGTFTTSVSTSYWQLLLSQGFCVGIGNGLVFTPTLAVVATHFNRKRSFAFGIVSAGNAVGGLVFPTMARQLLPKIGLAWTVRSMGLVQLVTLIAANFMIRPRLPPRPSGPFVDFAAFKEPEYAFFASGMFFTFVGVFFAFYYLPSFAITQLHPGMEYISALNVLLVINGVSLIGRLGPAFFADKILGPFTLMAPFTIAAAICVLLWRFVSSEGGLYAWAAVYGIVTGAIQSLFPPSLSSLTSDFSKIGVRTGMICTTNGIAVLIGPPIAGVLISVAGPSYEAAQGFVGGSMMLGGILFLTGRINKVRKPNNSWKMCI